MDKETRPYDLTEDEMDTIEALRRGDVRVVAVPRSVRSHGKGPVPTDHPTRGINHA